MQLEDESVNSLHTKTIQAVIADTNVLKQHVDNTTTSQENKQQSTLERTELNTNAIASVTAQKSKRELPKTSSIGSMFKNLEKQNVEKKVEAKLELTPENTIVIWNKFLNENKANLHSSFLSAAQSHPPVLEDDKIVFTASNNVTLEMLQLHKMDITAFFRLRTTSATVVPVFVLNRAESPIKDYKTNKDRLKDMIDSNASIMKLIEKFDLNME